MAKFKFRRLFESSSSREQRELEEHRLAAWNFISNNAPTENPFSELNHRELDNMMALEKVKQELANTNLREPWDISRWSRQTFDISDLYHSHKKPLPNGIYELSNSIVPEDLPSPYILIRVNNKWNSIRPIGDIKWKLPNKM